MIEDSPPGSLAPEGGRKENQSLRGGLGAPTTEFFAVALEKLTVGPAILAESSYRDERLGIEWTGLTTRSGWHWEPQAEGMTVLRGEHPEGAVLQLTRVRFTRFSSADAYLSHIQSEIASQQMISKPETYFPPGGGAGMIFWGGARTRGIVVVTIVQPRRHEGLRLVGYFEPEDLEWMRRELNALLPSLRLHPRQ